jgi:type IV pilus assembly protein PilV
MKFPGKKIGLRQIGHLQQGSSLIEVLVTLFILMVALVGLTGLMVQSQAAELESYQRMQALQIAQDLVSRMTSNPKQAACYVTANYMGTGVTAAPVCTGSAPGNAQDRAEKDMTEWDLLLKGRAELDNSGNKIGAVLGARGCVTAIASTDPTKANEYQVSVAWQGSIASFAPPAGITCGVGLYGVDTQRRAVSLTVHVPV